MNWYSDTKFEVSWVVKRDYKSKSSRLRSTSSKQYIKEFSTIEATLKFMKQKKKQWERQDIWNSIHLHDIERNQKLWCNISFEKDIDEWAKKNGLLGKEDTTTSTNETQREGVNNRW